MDHNGCFIDIHGWPVSGETLRTGNGHHGCSVKGHHGNDEEKGGFTWWSCT